MNHIQQGADLPRWDLNYKVRNTCLSLHSQADTFVILMWHSGENASFYWNNAISRYFHITGKWKFQAQMFMKSISEYDVKSTIEAIIEIFTWLW